MFKQETENCQHTQYDCQTLQSSDWKHDRQPVHDETAGCLEMENEHLWFILKHSSSYKNIPRLYAY